jgi:uncharacterized protein YdeI (BOF family)
VKQKTINMKKIFVLLLITVISTAAFAQTDSTMGKMHKMKSGEMMKGKDCVMMENGKMMVMKNGKTMDMDKDMTMSNGTTVMTDGTVKMKDGTTTMMTEGECVYMNGKMGKMKMDKMKTNKVKSDSLVN